MSVRDNRIRCLTMLEDVEACSVALLSVNLVHTCAPMNTQRVIPRLYAVRTSVGKVVGN